MKVNPNNLNFIDDVAKQIFVSGLNEKFATPEQFKSLASNSYHLATVLASQRDDFMKTQNLQDREAFTMPVVNTEESFHHVHSTAMGLTGCDAKVVKVKVEPKAEQYTTRVVKLGKAEKAEKAEKVAEKEKVVDVFETPLKAVASSEANGDIVQKRKRGRPPKAKAEVKVEATVVTKSKKK